MSKCTLCLKWDYVTRRHCSMCGETQCEECDPQQTDPCTECIWVDGPDSEARRAARAPDHTHTPAVRRVVAMEDIPLHALFVPVDGPYAGQLHSRWAIDADGRTNAESIPGGELRTLSLKRQCIPLRHRDERAAS